MKIREITKTESPPPPPPIDGIHTWLMSAAWHCRKSGVDTGEAVRFIQSHEGTLRRHLQPREAADAVERAYSAKLDSSIKFERIPELPEWNSRETARLYQEAGTTVQDLIDASPVQNPASIDPREILEQLFPDPAGLLCIGESKYKFLTASLKEHDRLDEKQFVTPAFMSAIHGETLEGKLSMHSKANTGERRFIVCDFDSPPPEEHAAIIAHLDGFRPLTMALSSGGKSLHAWFPVTGSIEDDRLFWRLCIALGADPALFRNHSQFVRLPNGTRDNGKPQSVIYLNPSTISQS
jgi:hypothetical protein